jgi:D-alanyl-D-alanine endopeptidase (penicillin-binding protein 7)
MKKLFVRILVVVVIIGALSMGVTVLFGARHDNITDAPGEGKAPLKAFELIKDVKTLKSVPKIRTESAIIVDLESGNIILGKNEENVRSIASLTKLATALTFLSTTPNLQVIETVTDADRLGAGRSRLRIGSKATLYDIFHLMLICSDNVAARIVARSTGLDSTQFVAKMNKMANSLKLLHTHFADPTGLDPANVSTAAELAIIFKTALDQPFISQVVAKKEFTFKSASSKRTITVHNTNHMLFGRQDIIGGKTGYISESGYCLVLGIDNGGGKKLAAVLLGAPTSGTRFRDAARLISSLSMPKRTSF